MKNIKFKGLIAFSIIFFSIYELFLYDYNPVDSDCFLCDGREQYRHDKAYDENQKALEEVRDGRLVLHTIIFIVIGFGAYKLGTRKKGNNIG